MNTYYEKIKNYSIEEMTDFILHQINSECSGNYNEDCKAEGYTNCKDCITKLLSREIL